MTTAPPRLALALAALLPACGTPMNPRGDAHTDAVDAARDTGLDAVADDTATLDAATDATTPDDTTAPLDAVVDDTATAQDTPAPPEDTATVEDTPAPPVDAGPAIPSCIPVGARTGGGGLCAGLNRAYTARGINVGYYAFRVVHPVKQYSGDFTGDPSTTFTAGGAARGVVLQTIPAGAYVGLSSVGPNYPSPAPCTGGCTDHSAACTDDSPPLRAPIANMYWGYGYSGASHMQGWIAAAPGDLEPANADPSHPCALGPAGLDWEVRSVCGAATACRGTNPTCGAVNTCNEGGDDCGSTTCGSMGGGALTPSAWRRTVTLPAHSHACTVMMPPAPGVTCLGNGGLADFFFVYPFGAYLYWAQNSTTQHWLHYGDRVQVYFHNRDAQGVLWDFVEVLASGAPTLTPASSGRGGAAPCSSTNPGACTPCIDGGTCGWVQDVFLQ